MPRQETGFTRLTLLGLAHSSPSPNAVVAALHQQATAVGDTDLFEALSRQPNLPAEAVTSLLSRGSAKVIESWLYARAKTLTDDLYDPDLLRTVADGESRATVCAALAYQPDLPADVAEKLADHGSLNVHARLTCNRNIPLPVRVAAAKRLVDVFERRTHQFHEQAVDVLRRDEALDLIPHLPAYPLVQLRGIAPGGRHAEHFTDDAFTAAYHRLLVEDVLRRQHGRTQLIEGVRYRIEGLHVAALEHSPGAIEAFDRLAEVARHATDESRYVAVRALLDRNVRLSERLRTAEEPQLIALVGLMRAANVKLDGAFARAVLLNGEVSDEVAVTQWPSFSDEGRRDGLREQTLDELVASGRRSRAVAWAATQAPRHLKDLLRQRDEQFRIDVVCAMLTREPHNANEAAYHVTLAVEHGLLDAVPLDTARKAVSTLPDRDKLEGRRSIYQQEMEASWCLLAGLQGLVGVSGAFETASTLFDELDGTYSDLVTTARLLAASGDSC